MLRNAALVVSTALAAADAFTHMNPSMQYVLSNPASGHDNQGQEFYGSSFFEVDSPIMPMKYSEIVWKTLPAVDLPKEVLEKYANSTMAVTGFEVDVLRKNPTTGKTESVPAYESYNHHYGVTLLSTAVKLKLDENGKATGKDWGHGKVMETELREEVAVPPATARLAQSFIHGNGQEHRQIFHGAPKGYVQPLFSPGQFVVTPMQISTNDGTGRKGPGGAGGPWLLPKIKSPGGLTPANPEARYSPLLECPCTDRIKIDGKAGTVNGGHFNGDCNRPEPLSDLNATKNPTCLAGTYVGGLSCCPDGGFLLDKDQEVPPFVDNVFFRFRFYYEDYEPTTHADINHVEWASNGCDSGCGGKCPNNCRHIEFDVVQGVGSKYSPDVQVFQTTFPAGHMLAASCSMKDAQCMDGRTVGDKGFKLIMAASHCHAPNCIKQELINKDTGEVLCSGRAVVGTTEQIFHEEGYIFTPPCLWGDDDSLVSPPVLKKDTTLQMTTYFNSTYGHPGQMGIWQMKAAVVH